MRAIAFLLLQLPQVDGWLWLIPQAGLRKSGSLRIYVDTIPL
jgi:hypothetical protein